jgi:hypothetical protein
MDRPQLLALGLSCSSTLPIRLGLTEPALVEGPISADTLLRASRLAELRSDGMPLKLLTIKAQQQERASLERVVRQVVLKVLSEVLPGTFPPPQPPRPFLRLIEGGTDGGDKPSTD